MTDCSEIQDGGHYTGISYISDHVVHSDEIPTPATTFSEMTTVTPMKTMGHRLHKVCFLSEKRRHSLYSAFYKLL